MSSIASTVVAAVQKLEAYGIEPGKTNVQKLIYLSSPPEKKREHFSAYHYGPFSRTVHNVLSALINCDVLSYKSQQLRVNDGVKFDNLNRELEKRLDIAARFLQSHGLQNQREISLLAKVDLIERSKRNREGSDKIAFVKTQAKVLGWSELSRASNSEIRKYRELQSELSNEIDQVAIPTG